MKGSLIAFDVDGTLVASGYDKIVHVMYSAYAACYGTAFRRFLDLGDLEGDFARIMETHLWNGGAPRFEQLAAIVNTLVNRCSDAVKPEELGVDEKLVAEYEMVRRMFNDIYSALNDAASREYWRLFPSVEGTLPALRQSYDLSIASGITQDILEEDLARHDIDLSLFVEVRGADERGGTDKADILRALRGRGYGEILFVGDSTRDQEYAVEAEVKFFRAWRDEDFGRLTEALKRGLPDEREPWSYTDADKESFTRKTLLLMRELVGGSAPMAEQATRIIHGEA